MLSLPKTHQPTSGLFYQRDVVQYKEKQQLSLLTRMQAALKSSWCTVLNQRREDAVTGL